MFCDSGVLGPMRLASDLGVLGPVRGALFVPGVCWGSCVGVWVCGCVVRGWCGVRECVSVWVCPLCGCVRRKCGPGWRFVIL